MNVYTALSASTRREIIGLLAKRGQLCVSEIDTHFYISQLAISQHLKILHSADIISVEKYSQQRLYEINHTTLQNLASWAIKLGSQHKQFTRDGMEAGAT